MDSSKLQSLRLTDVDIVANSYQAPVFRSSQTARQSQGLVETPRTSSFKQEELTSRLSGTPKKRSSLFGSFSMRKTPTLKSKLISLNTQNNIKITKEVRLYRSNLI